MKHFKIAVLRSVRDLLPRSQGRGGRAVRRHGPGRARRRRPDGRRRPRHGRQAGLGGEHPGGGTGRRLCARVAYCELDHASQPRSRTGTRQTRCRNSPSQLDADAVMRDVDVEPAELADATKSQRRLRHPDRHGLDLFLKAIGRNSFALTSTVSAAKAGGNAQSLNVMFVLDATGSMGDADSNCTGVPGFNDQRRPQEDPDPLPVRALFDPERAEGDADVARQGRA